VWLVDAAKSDDAVFDAMIGHVLGAEADAAATPAADLTAATDGLAGGSMDVVWPPVGLASITKENASEPGHRPPDLKRFLCESERGPVRISDAA